MLQPDSINPLWINLIKVVSPIFMVGAIIVDGLIAYRWTQGQSLPKVYTALGAVGSVALSFHLLEGIAAGFMAKKRGLNVLQFGIYTFFVGTVAFIDLMNNETE